MTLENLEEQKLKFEIEIEKLEQKENEIKEKRKKIRAKIKSLEEKIAEEKDRQLLCIIKENFGEVTEENLEDFERAIRSLRNNQQTDHDHGNADAATSSNQHPEITFPM